MRFWTVFGHPKPIIRNPKYDPLVVSQRVHSDKRSTSSYMNLDPVTSLRENRDFPTQTDDPQLPGVVDAWPVLPQAIRAGILAMVKASRPEPTPPRGETGLCPRRGFGLEPHEKTHGWRFPSLSRGR